MKKFTFLFLLFILVISIISCKKDKDDVDPFSTPFSQEDPEESKAKVEDAGISFINEMENLENANAFEVLNNFNELQSSDEELKSTKVLTPLQFGTEASAKSIYRSLKSVSADPTSLTEAWDQVVGTYEWNFDLQEFDFEEGTDKIIFRFPGKESDDENTATITVSNFAVVEINGLIYEYPNEDWDPELPTKVVLTLEYKGDNLASYELSASYTEEGLPKNVTSKLTIEDFVFTVSASHSPYTKASFTYNLKKGSNLLLEMYFAANGEWTEENIETSEGPEDVINNANAHFILMNIKVAGKVNFKELSASMESIEEEYLDEWGDVNPGDAEDYSDAVIETINKHAELVVVYAGNNTKIAEAEAYTFYDEDEDDYYPGIRFVYADGSKEDALDFANNQLDSFYTELNNFIDDLNDKYGLEIEEVVPSAK